MNEMAWYLVQNVMNNEIVLTTRDISIKLLIIDMDKSVG